MKQKDIILWTISGLALILSLVAIFGSRINGVQTFAAKSRLTASQSQLTTGINGSPTFGGTVTANGQGPAGCAALEQALTQALNNPEITGDGGDSLGQGIAQFIQLCGGLDSQFCSALDQAGANQQILINNTPVGEDVDDNDIEWRDRLFAAHQVFCGGGGGVSINPNQPGYQDSGESEDLLQQLCAILNLHTGPCAGY